LVSREPYDQGIKVRRSALRARVIGMKGRSNWENRRQNSVISQKKGHTLEGDFVLKKKKRG